MENNRFAIAVSPALLNKDVITDALREEDRGHAKNPISQIFGLRGDRVSFRDIQHGPA
jgi:hypothetical protein